MDTGCVPDVHGVSDPLELELQVLVSCHVGAGNQTLVLGKSIQCFNCCAIPPGPKFSYLLNVYRVAVDCHEDQNQIHLIHSLPGFSWSPLDRIG